MVNVISTTKAKAAHRKSMLADMNFIRVNAQVANNEFNRKDEIRIITPANQDYKIKDDRS